MKIEEYLDCAVDAEDFMDAKDLIAQRLADIEDAIYEQASATKNLVVAVYNVANAIENHH